MPDAFDEHLEQYLTYLQVERHASPYTVRNYNSDLKDLFDFLRARGITTPQEVDKHNLRQYMFDLSKRIIVIKQGITKQGLVKPSIARKQTAIRTFYHYLKREGIIAESPIPLSRKGGRLASFSIKLERRLPSFLTVTETVRLLKAPDLATPQGLRDRAIMELLYASGLRVSELVALNLEQVNIHTHELRVWGKGSKERIVLMGEPAANSLSDYLSQGRPELLGRKKSSTLFVNRYGERLSGRMVQKRLLKHAGSAGIKKRVHPHVLRHTFATHMLDGGADLRVVQELLGHSQLSSTQIYTHVTKAQAKRVYRASHPMAENDDEDDNAGQIAKVTPKAS